MARPEAALTVQVLAIVFPNGYNDIDR
jgi:hypothetical protein